LTVGFGVGLVVAQVVREGSGEISGDELGVILSVFKLESEVVEAASGRDGRLAYEKTPIPARIKIPAIVPNMMFLLI
jgi:hypothetical protein